MSTATPMPTAPAQHAVLHGIRFETYERLVDDLESPVLRLTYDEGVLEIMSPSQRHERAKYWIRRLIDVATEELRVEVLGGCSTTWRRKDLKKGLEPDECYWVQNEKHVRGRMDLDLRVDPPPDLCIEVDVYALSLNRLSIYAALGMPEVWRYEDGRFTVYLRLEDGSYRVSNSSACFPWFPMPELNGWVARGCEWSEGQMSFIRLFREWVRNNLTPPRGSS